MSIESKLAVAPFSSKVDGIGKRLRRDFFAAPSTSSRFLEKICWGEILRGGRRDVFLSNVSFARKKKLYLLPPLASHPRDLVSVLCAAFPKPLLSYVTEILKRYREKRRFFSRVRDEEGGSMSSFSYSCGSLARVSIRYPEDFLYRERG